VEPRQPEARRDLLTVVANESVGVVAARRGTNAEGSELEFELLVLPLRHRRPHRRARFGALAPAEVPYCSA